MRPSEPFAADRGSGSQHRTAWWSCRQKPRWSGSRSATTTPGSGPAPGDASRSSPPTTAPGSARGPEISALPRLLAVSPDGARLAMGRWDRQVHVLDRRTGAPLTPQMDHQARGSVTHGRFSADGSRLVTMSHEQVRVWSGISGQLLAPPFAHDVRVNDAAIDPAGSRVAISTYPRRDGMAGVPSLIHIWSLAPDTRPTDIVRLTAQLASGRRVDDAGGFVPLTHNQFRLAWEALEARRPPGEMETTAELWHRQQAASGDAFGRKFHARQVVRHRRSNGGTPCSTRAGRRSSMIGATSTTAGGTCWKTRSPARLRRLPSLKALCLRARSPPARRSRSSGGPVGCA